MGDVRYDPRREPLGDELRDRVPGSWSTQTLTSYMGGTAKASSVVNATATLTFTGKQVAWLSRLSNINGQARVYIDNVLIATVNTFSSTVQPKRVVFTWMSPRR